MIQENENSESRQLKNGDWYWIQKAVIQEYAPRIGSMAVMVYNLLASQVNRRQTCFPSQKYMAERLGCSRATVNKAIGRLNRTGLIEVERRERYRLVYRLLQLRCKEKKPQSSTLGNSAIKYLDTNDNDLTKYNNDIDRFKKIKPPSAPYNDFQPQTREELLALDLAQGLDDLPALPLYLSYARKYPEALLRRGLAEARSLPAQKIRKSRGAFFNYLIQKHASKDS